MSLDTALFLIDRGGQNFKVSGSTIGDKIKNGDSVLVQRGNTRFKSTYNNGFNNILDTDLLLARQGDANYRVTGANFLDLICVPPRNTLSGPSSSTYGTQYTLYYTQSGHTSGDLDGSTVNASNGSKTYRRYPTKEQTYVSILTSTNSCGTATATVSVKIPGYSVSPATINGVPSEPKKKDEFIVSASYNNSGNLKNVSYKWELESGIDSGFANFNGNAAGRPGLFVSTDASPRIYCINNTHNQFGNPVQNPPGYLPDGVKLKLTITNKDNNESASTSVRFKIYPKF